MDYQQARERTNAFNEYIIKEIPKIFRLRRLQIFRGKGQTISAYVVTLKKIPEQSLAQRGEAFYLALKKALLPQERLIGENRCFRIIGDGYEILYCVEAYRKNAEEVVFFEDEKMQISYLGRMGCEAAIHYLRKLEKDSIVGAPSKQFPAVFSKMNSADWMEQFQNPADRFVHLVLQYKRQSIDN